MTVIHGIEIDEFPPVDTIKYAIANNQPLDSVLHVILVVSNPCMYARRYLLAKQCIHRLRSEKNIQVYVVELAYGNQQFYVTKPYCKTHLQLRTRDVLWHKENMINLGIQKLLPSNWKAAAWIDADVEFTSSTWALDCLKVLNGTADILQLWELAIDQGPRNETLKIFQSFGYFHSRGSKDATVWHPGFAWAITHKAYDTIGGLYDVSILGSGDHNMAMCFRDVDKALNEKCTDGYKASMEEWGHKAAGLRLAYIPGTLRHYFHGSKKNRRYHDRWEILVNHQFNPSTHLCRVHGLLQFSSECPPQLQTHILEYFQQRNEDEFFRR